MEIIHKKTGAVLGRDRYFEKYESDNFNVELVLNHKRQSQNDPHKVFQRARIPQQGPEVGTHSHAEATRASEAIPVS